MASISIYISMLLCLKYFLLAVLSIDVCLCEAEVNNSTVISRREILEQQARTAYQNACYRLQELSNWMTAVFRIKSVWASATVNEISARSEGSFAESEQRSKSGLPPRFKATGSECSLSSVQVTAQTYVYLQSQLVMMKWLLGRNIFKSSKERLAGANTSLRDMKMLETFNTTLNGVVSKLKQNTANTSTPVDSETRKAGNIIKDVQEGRFLQFLQVPKTLFMNILDDQVMHNRTRDQSEPRNFFQSLGKNLDKLFFPIVPVKQNASSEHSVSTTDVSTTDVSTADVSTAKVSTANVSTKNVVMFSSIL